LYRKSDKEEDQNSFVVLTMDSNGTKIADIHHRMPVFLDDFNVDLWLDPNVSF